MNKTMTIFRMLFVSCLLTVGISTSRAVDVVFTLDEGVSRPAGLTAAERNLGQLLTEVNRAQKADVPVNSRALKMTDFARKSMERIWAVTPFYCPDDEVVEHCWTFRNGTMMARTIPIIIQPKGEVFGLDTYQQVVVEFDRNGTITDFRFPLSAHNMNQFSGNEVVSTEQQMIILQQLERFRTAYNQKDITVIENMFSDDALIITGHVTQTRAQGDSRMMTPKVTFNKQNKQQYIANLKRAFARNKWIQVDFSEEVITASSVDNTMYGIKLHQSWKSSNYSDEGLLFLIWQFPNDGSDPIIHVRTWQPSEVNGKRIAPVDDISTLGGFDL